MEQYYEVPVFVQETNEVITLTLSAEQLEAVKADENCLQQFVADSSSFQQTSKRGRADVPIQSSTGEVQSRTEHIESKTGQVQPRTEQVHLDQENRTEKETVDHNSERTDIWPEAAVFLFLEVFRAKEDEFKKTKRHNKIWQEMADELQNKNKNYNYTASQCANKISGLKRTYKTIKDQNRKSGNCRVSWPYYSVMESIFGDKAYVVPPSLASSEGPEKDLQPSTSTALDTPIKRKKKDNTIDILGEIQKSNNDFRVYLEKKQKRDEERLKLEVEKVAVQKSLLSFLEKSMNKD